MSKHSSSTAAACTLAFALSAAILPAAAQENVGAPRDAAEAADAVMKAARERAEADERAAATQLIRESRILFPQRAGQFELQRSARDPEPHNGVTLVYRYDSNLDTDFEITVWPVGQMAEDLALAGAARRRGDCMNVRMGVAEGVTVVESAEWKPHAIELANGGELQGRRRSCTSLDAQSKRRLVYHTLMAYRDFYLIELHVTADASDSRRAAKLVDKAGNDLFPQIHVQNVGNCTPPGKPKLILVDEIDRGADRVSSDGSHIYATRKPGERELAKLMETAAERRRQTSCVVSFNLASQLPGEKFEMLRFPAGSFQTLPALVPARAKEK